MAFFASTLKANLNIFIHFSMKNLFTVQAFIVAHFFNFCFSFFFLFVDLNKYYTRKTRDLQKLFFSTLHFGSLKKWSRRFAISRLLDYFYCFIACEKKENWKFLHNEKKREVAVLPKWCCIISKNYVSFTVWKTMKLLLFLFFAKQFFFFLLYKTFRNIIFLFCWERLLRWEFFLRVFYIWIWLLKRNLWFSFWRRVSAWHFFAGSFDDLSGCCELEKCEVVSIQRYLEHFAAFSVFNHNLFWRIQTMRFCGFSKIDQSLFFEGTRLLKNQQLLWNFWVVCTLLLSKII